MAARKKISRDAIEKARRLLLDAVDGADSEEEAVRAAVSVIQRSYYSDVKGIGDELIEQIKDGEIKDSEKFTEDLEQSVDNSSRVIYTWNARLGLLVTEHLDEAEDRFGEKPKTPEQQLFAAMCREVSEYVEREVGDIEAFIDEQQEGR